ICSLTVGSAAATFGWAMGKRPGTEGMGTSVPETCVPFPTSASPCCCPKASAEAQTNNMWTSFDTHANLVGCSVLERRRADDMLSLLTAYSDISSISDRRNTYRQLPALELTGSARLRKYART